MNANLKRLNEQVIVITGASSGIGLATAEQAVRAGAKVVLAARSARTLEKISERLKNAGGQVLAVAVDVSDRSQVEELLRHAVDSFGIVDTWVNNAGVSIYGRLDEISEADSRRLFDINFWGVVNGSLVAIEHLSLHGGALINIGSEVSEAVVPLQGMYSASKHAVKGFTDALRVEIEEVDRTRVSITLIQPTAVNTPYPQHARNYLQNEPQLPTPQIDPHDVANAILDAAVNPRRDVKVGMMAKVNTVVASLMPTLADKMSAKQADRQTRDETPRDPEGTLYRGGESGRIYGEGAEA